MTLMLNLIDLRKLIKKKLFLNIKKRKFVSVVEARSWWKLKKMLFLSSWSNTSRRLRWCSRHDPADCASFSDCFWWSSWDIGWQRRRRPPQCWCSTGASARWCCWRCRGKTAPCSRAADANEKSDGALVLARRVADSFLDCSFDGAQTTPHPIRQWPQQTPDQMQCRLTSLACPPMRTLLASVEVDDDDGGESVGSWLLIFGAAMMSMLVAKKMMIIGKLLLNNDETNGLLMTVTSRWQMMSTLYFSSF